MTNGSKDVLEGHAHSRAEDSSQTDEPSASRPRTRYNTHLESRWRKGVVGGFAAKRTGSARASAVRLWFGVTSCHKCQCSSVTNVKGGVIPKCMFWYYPPPNTTLIPKQLSWLCRRSGACACCGPLPASPTGSPPDRQLACVCAPRPPPRGRAILEKDNPEENTISSATSPASSTSSTVFLYLLACQQRRCSS